MSELKMPHRLSHSKMSEQCPGCDNSVWLHATGYTEESALSFTGYCLVCHLEIVLSVKLKENHTVDT